MGFRYEIPAGVQPYQSGRRPLLSTPQGGRVVVDSTLLALWEYADGKLLSEIVSGFKGENIFPDVIRAGLGCLADAGLLLRKGLASEIEFSPFEKVEGPLVSVVVVSYQSQEWLAECLPSLLHQSYRHLEIIVVDNGCQDNSTEWVQMNYPQVRLHCLLQPETFARATNGGVAIASGEYIFLLNPDVRLEPDAIAQMVAVAQTQQRPVIVGAKLKFWWAPAFLNGLGNRVGAFSWGMDNALGHLDLGQFDHWVELPSACYAAVMFHHQIWGSVGPADDKFPMYYEDSEWSYRARLLGYQILAAPKAVVYHAFGGRAPSGQESHLTPRKLRNVVYGRYRFAFKLVGDHLPQFLRNYWLEDWSNFARLLFQRDFASARSYLQGWWAVLCALNELRCERKNIQTRRVISDEALFAVQRDIPPTQAWNGMPELTWDLVVHQYLPLILAGRTHPMPEFDPLQRNCHLLIVSHDIVGQKMAGPGMRYLEMARSLSPHLDVTLAVPSETSLEVPGIRIVRYWENRPGSLQVLVENCDVALISGYMVTKFPFLHFTQKRLVVDFYDPLILENLHYYLNEPLENQEVLNRQVKDLTNQLAGLGDYFICGNERQRDYWMGVLSANGRVNPRNFIKDDSLRSLIDVVTIGLPDREPVARPLLKGVHPQIPLDARIVLWGGGIWNWLDPITLVNAWPKVIARYPEARLIFLGTRHPNPSVPRHEMAKKTEDLAQEIGEKDHTIIFVEWLSYEDREALLTEADVGVVLHPIHVETRYSMRTRVLDYWWAKLPVLITEGDVTSEMILQQQLGEVVPPFDAEAVAQALIKLLESPKSVWGPRYQKLHQTMRWSQVVQPLLKYCLEGERAPDLGMRGAVAAPVTPGSTQGLMARARYIYRTEGGRVLLHRVWRHIQWRLSR